LLFRTYRALIKEWLSFGKEITTLKGRYIKLSFVAIDKW
jgi:hypothetical protein